MKDGYKYKDGYIIVANYTNSDIREEEIRPYQDNIDKILINENIIEELNNIKNDLTTELETYENYIREGKTNIILGSIIFALGTLFIGTIASFIINPVLSYLVSLIFFSIIIGKPTIYDMIQVILESKRDIKGCNIALKEVEKELTKVNQEQNEIEKCKEKVKEEELKKDSSYRQLNYVEKLKELREYLTMISFYEMCKEQLSTYDEQGILEEKLKDELDSSQMKTLRRIINTKQYKTNEF